MKRIGALLALATVVAATVLLVQRASRDREYQALLQAGERALDGGDSYAAIEAFSGALILRPDSMVAHFQRGRAYRAQRGDDEAIRDLREAIRLAPDAPQPLAELAELYDVAGDAAEAAHWYAQAARFKADDPTLLYKLALARYGAGSPADAVEPLRQAILSNDSIGEFHYLLGLVYRDTDRVNDAIASLERAVKVAPSLSPAREELADLYSSQGRWGDEMAQLQKLAVLDAQTRRTVAIGLAEARQGQFAGALGTLRQAARQAPSNSQVQLALGRVYLARAERTADEASVSHALDALEKALGLTTRQSEALALFGRALYLAADYEGAERILSEAVATSPVDPEAFDYLADACERVSHFEEARDALLTLDALQADTATDATRSERARRIGALSLQANDAPGAVTYLNRAVAAGRQTAALLGVLAQARWQVGDADGAREALSRALALQPDSVELLRLKRTVK